MRKTDVAICFGKLKTLRGLISQIYSFAEAKCKKNLDKLWNAIMIASSIVQLKFFPTKR